MKLGSLIQAGRIINSQANKQVSAQLAYKMMKFMKAIKDEQEFYDSELNKIIEDCAQKGEDGKISQTEGRIQISNGKMNECQTRMNSLNETEIEQPKIRFKLSELSELKLSMADCFSLDEFITEEE